jgi:hypothetical protein
VISIKVRVIYIHLSIEVTSRERTDPPSPRLPSEGLVHAGISGAEKETQTHRANFSAGTVAILLSLSEPPCLLHS